MDAASIPSRTAAIVVPVLPAWARPSGTETALPTAAFLAGTALNCLDNLVRAEPPWAGAWRARLALDCAVSAARQLGRAEEAGELRDAWVLRAPDSDPGPAGRLYAAWRRLGTRSPTIDGTSLQSVGGLLGVSASAALADLPDAVERQVGGGLPAPLAAAALLRAVEITQPQAGLLGWWMADQVLARRLRWPLTVPLLMGEAHSAVFRRGSRAGRLRPAEEGFDAALCLAVTQGATRALRCAAEIAPRAARLEQVAPKLRARGAREAIDVLLTEDAVSGTLTTASLSRWGARRLFERLETLGAARELTGRSAFRLYGL